MRCRAAPMAHVVHSCATMGMRQNRDGKGFGAVAVLSCVLFAACGPGAEPPAEPTLSAEARLVQGTIVDAAPRLFSAPVLDSLQRIGDVPATFVVTPDTIILAAGEAVPLTRLGFDARNAEGEQLPSLPILLTLDTDIAAIEADSLRGVRPGESVLWVRSLVGRADSDRGRPIHVIVN